MVSNIRLADTLIRNSVKYLVYEDEKGGLYKKELKDGSKREELLDKSEYQLIGYSMVILENEDYEKRN